MTNINDYIYISSDGGSILNPSSFSAKETPEGTVMVSKNLKSSEILFVTEKDGELSACPIEDRGPGRDKLTEKELSLLPPKHQASLGKKGHGTTTDKALDKSSSYPSNYTAAMTELTKVANKLDSLGLSDKADELDSIIVAIAKKEDEKNEYTEEQLKHFDPDGNGTPFEKSDWKLMNKADDEICPNCKNEAKDGGCGCS